MEAFRLTSRVRAVSRSAAAGGSWAQNLTSKRSSTGHATVGHSASDLATSGYVTPELVTPGLAASNPSTAAGQDSESTSDLAVPVPWRVTARSANGVIEIEHSGAGPLRAVRCVLAGGGLLGLSLPRTMYPGERLRVVVRGVYADGAIASPDSMLVLRWFEPDGRELLWPIAL